MRENTVCRLLLISVILIPVLASCANLSETSQTVSSDAIQVEYINGPELHISDTLSFRIKNTSKACITFPYDFGLKIYYMNQDSWAETGNLVQYPAVGQDITLQPTGNLFSERSVYLHPDTSKLKINAPTDFKAIIQGHLCNNKTIVIEKEILFTVSP